MGSRCGSGTATWQSGWHDRVEPGTGGIPVTGFVEVRRRTRPMVCFVNVASVDRIIYSIFHRFNLEWRNRTLLVFTQAA
jgi:hypothetical protein